MRFAVSVVVPELGSTADAVTEDELETRHRDPPFAPPGAMAGGGQGERKSSRIQGSRFPAEAAAAVACERPPGARTTGCGFDGLAFVFCRAPGAFHPQAVPPRL